MKEISIVSKLVIVLGISITIVTPNTVTYADGNSIQELQKLQETQEDMKITEEDIEETYTPEQKELMKNLEKNIESYEEYGETAPIQSDIKNKTRAKAGSWSWRDGVICVTNQGSNMLVTNSWHAGIIAPQANYVVAEAEGVGKKVRLRSGAWSSNKYTIWQMGVKKTSVAQDLAAGRWAGNQKGKPYNLNFWNIKQKNSFYCSQLVWAAYYYTCGVDLDKTDNNIGTAWAVHPGEFVNNSQTALLYRNK